MTYLDAQMQAFVEHSLSYYLADAVAAKMQQQRQWYSRFCESMASPRPSKLVIQNANVLGLDGHKIPLRHYKPTHLSAAPLNQKIQVVYFHGGGFVLGGLDSHDNVCAEIADICAVKLVAVDYRLAPEHQYPCDINDCLALVDDLLMQGKQLILVGDSAGGTLAACVSNARANFTGTQLLAQVLIYPSLAGDTTTKSRQEHANAPMLTQADMTFYRAVRLGGLESKVPTQDALYCPLQAQSFGGLPPGYLFSAQVDPLHDDCELYQQALQAAGIKVENHIKLGRGLVHGYLRARHTSDKAAANFAAL